MKKELKETKKQIDGLRDLTEKEKKELFEGLKEIEKLDENELKKIISNKKELNHCYGIDTVDWNEILGKKAKNENLKTKEIFRELKKAERKYNKKLKKFSSDNPKSNTHSLGVDCSDASG